MSRALKIILILIFVSLVGATAFACAKETGAASDKITSDEKLTANPVSYEGGAVNEAQNEGAQNADGYTATFVTGGGTAVSPVTGLTVDFQITTYTGYVFAGWFLTSDYSDSPAVFPYTMYQDVVFYAKWAVQGVKEIRSVQDLKDVKNAMSSSYILMTDLDLRGVDWTPLGMKLKKAQTLDSDKVRLDGAIVPFTGNFDGNGRTIYNLNLVPANEEEEFNYLPYGLFSVLGAGGLISNLRINTFRITLDGGFSNFYLGSLVGQMKGGAVRYCQSTGIINNPKLIYEGTIWDEFLGSYADPTEDTFMGGLIGGIVGGEVSFCSTEGSIISESQADGDFIGGLAGFNWAGTIRNSHSSVNITARYGGGLVGYNNGGIYDSYALGTVGGSLSYPAVAGGFSAYNDINGIIERCYAIGAVSARTAGGLVGINIFNYSKNSPLNIAGDPIIQALGTNEQDIDPGTGGVIRNCYAKGNVSSSEYGGGLIGRSEAMMPVKGREDVKSYVNNNYYFIEFNFAFGDVSVNAVETYFEDENGVMRKVVGVYYAVFAGGLVGHASELRINSCLAFGDVAALSRRPVVSGDSYVYNPAYAENVIGNFSALIKINTSTHYLLSSRDVYGCTGQTVKRNNADYVSFNAATPLPYTGNGDRNVNNANFLTGRQDFGAGLGFSAAIWNFDNLNIENGRYPTLRY